jgi:tetratricopeptide (TPR) repeat protein
MLDDPVRIKTMRRATIILVGFLTVILSLAGRASADEPAALPPISCGNGIPGGVNCVASKSELKEAHRDFARGVKLQQRQQLEEALAQFGEAARLAPRNLQFLTARELVKAQLVFDHVERGNILLLQGARGQAAAEFRAALELDVSNQSARERLAEATRLSSRPPVVPAVQVVDEGEIRLAPKSDVATFHYAGDLRGLFSELAAAYGVTVQFDESLQNRQVVFNVDNVDFFTALKLACQISKTMWAALEPHQLLIADDKPDNHKQFDRMSLQTLILPAHSTPQEATELVTALRTLFDLRFISSGLTAAGTVEIRAPGRILDACDKLIVQIDNQHPEVSFDVSIFQINHQLMRDIGLHVPDTFNLYNIPAVALAGLGGQNINQLINQLISSGGINQAGGTALSGLLAQLQGSGSSIFNTPLTTFGGGLTLEGLSLDQLTTSLSVNESWVRSLEHLIMRADQGSDANFHLGERYPIQNASYAPIYNSPQISQVLGNQTYVPPFPSVSYEDLGLNVKATPIVHGNNDVSVKLELQVRSLTGESSNGVPVISNREFQGSINLKDGEPAVVAGQISMTDMLAMTGIPGFGFLPLLNNVMVTNNKQQEYDELLIIITPHVLANFKRSTPEIWITER